METRAEVVYRIGIQHAQRIDTDERIKCPRAITICIGGVIMYEKIKVNTLSKEYEQVLDIYKVDKYGNVYGNNEMELKQSCNNRGYKQVALKMKNTRRWKKCYVHRLVGAAFVEGYSEKKNEIDHIDTNKHNNFYKNLKWVTHKENRQNPLTKEKMKGVGGEKCYVYDYLLNYIGVFSSLSKAEDEIGESVKGTNIRTKTHYILEKPDLEIVLKINRKQKITSIVITNIETKEKVYFHSNREARKFFNNKVNITQAIQHNWTVWGKFKVRNLNYKKLIGMLDL